MLVLGRNDGVSNEDYHADREYISSSGLKMLHKSPSDYNKKYNLKIVEDAPTNSAALTFGTVAHLLLLEPHLYETDVVVYDGPVRAGAAFNAFKEANAGKNIIINSEFDKLTKLNAAYRQNKTATELLEGCEVEATYCSNIYGEPLVKVRCDAINPEAGYILDVKTTSAKTNTEDFRDIVANMYYDLSAALYVDVCAREYNKDFDFYFLVLSKADLGCKVYKASKQTLDMGRAKIKETLALYKRCKSSGVWAYTEADLANASTRQDRIEEV